MQTYCLFTSPVKPSHAQYGLTLCCTLIIRVVSYAKPIDLKIKAVILTDSQHNEQYPPLRLDKWLWAARFFKTRAQAKSAIEGGKVKYNDKDVKPSRSVEIGAKVRITHSASTQTVIVLKLNHQRRPYAEACLLYEETADSLEKRQLLSEQKKNIGYQPSQRAPDKKQRRALHKLQRQGRE